MYFKTGEGNQARGVLGKLQSRSCTMKLKKRLSSFRIDTIFLISKKVPCSVLEESISFCESSLHNKLQLCTYVWFYMVIFSVDGLWIDEGFLNPDTIAVEYSGEYVP